MINLSSVNDVIQVQTATDAPVDVHATWVDIVVSTSAITPGRKNTPITVGGFAVVTPAPAASTQRNLKTLHVRNKHPSLSCDVTVRHTDGTTVCELYKTALLAGRMLQYTDQGGFVVMG